MNKKSPGGNDSNLDDKQLRQIVISTANGINRDYLLAQDNAIIGIGFAQFVLEGRIDKDIKLLTTIAIKRELLPILINDYDENYREKRREQLTKMLSVVTMATS